MGNGQVDSAVIDALYGPALHDGNWKPALFRASELLACAEVSMAGFEPGDISVFETTARVLSDEARTRYAQYYGELDPKLRLFARRSEGFLFNDSAHFDDVFVSRDPFYQEFSRWVGTRHTLDIAIAPDRLRPIYFAAMRTETQGRFQSPTEAVFSELARHFGRVHALRARLHDARSSLELARGALSTLGFGLIVLDERGVVRLVNAGAEMALSAGGALQVREGRLIGRTAELDRTIQALIGRALVGDASGASVASVATEDRAGWILWVTPLPASSPLAPRAAPGVLILIGHGGTGRVARDDLMTLYGLTAAEADLALALASGRSLQEAADDRSVRISTARSQLLAILGKTGLHRQSDLARLIAGLPGAILLSDQRSV
jgi:DNA-binding CsgD family transcriptional regulator